jgi:hypothetical protein
MKAGFGKAVSKSCSVVSQPQSVRRPANVVAVTDKDRRANQNKQADCNQQPGSATGALPFFQSDSPQRAENDDSGHRQCPTGELVPSHLCLAHGVKEKLLVPGRAGKGSLEQAKDESRVPSLRLCVHLWFGYFARRECRLDFLLPVELSSELVVLTFLVFRFCTAERCGGQSARFELGAKH